VGHDVRPRILRDAYFVPIENDGVFFRSTHRTLTIRDVPIFPWIERLSPYLDGQHTVDELIARLPDDKRKLITQLVDQLHVHGMVRDLDQDTPHRLTAHELALYEPELAYIESYADSAEHHFERFRETRCLLIGAGPKLDAAWRAALKMGLRSVVALITDEIETDTRALKHAAEARHAVDDKQSFYCERIAPGGTDRVYWRERVEEYSLIVHFAEPGTLARAALIDDVCQEAGRTLLQEVTVGDCSWIGPISMAGAPATCWRAAWGRIEAAAQDVSAGAAKVSPFLTGAVPAIIANQAMFRTFCHLTKSGELDWSMHVLRLDLESLQTSIHRFHPDPASLPAAPLSRDDFLRHIEKLRTRPAQDLREFSQTAIDYLDERAGIFARIDEESSSQLPLRISRVIVNLPFGMRHRRAVFAGGWDFESARMTAMRRAIETYAAATIDPRRMRQGSNEVWGLDLNSGAPVLVSATELRGNDVGDYSLSACVSVATSAESWSSAVTQGLLAVCERLVQSRVVGAKSLKWLRSDTSNPDPMVARLASLLETAGEQISTCEVDSSLKIPTVAVFAGSQTVAVSCGCSVDAALATGLFRALQRWQAVTAGETHYMPIAVRQILLSEKLMSEPKPIAAGPALTDDDLVRLIRDAGYSVVAVPLDHDPALAGLAPYTLWIIVRERS
jgi:putative thiazole-containing bacteriocin maturation protein